MPINISRIIFTGDPFRSAEGEASQISNVVWLQKRLGELFFRLTDIPQEIILPLTKSQTVGDILATQDPNLTPSLDSWARVFWEEASPSLVNQIARECKESMVVTIEMPPVLADALNRADIPWIDVGISPLRFMPDWAFHVKTSKHFSIDTIRDYVLTSTEIQRYADHVRGWYGAADISEPTVVFFAQTLHDRTLIRDQRFLGKHDVLDKIKPLRNKRPLLIKPHPWRSTSDIIDVLTNEGGVITNINTYSLLSSPLVEVVTLSSSVGREAPVFGRKTNIISPSVQEWAFSGVDVLRYSLSPLFWETLFSSVGLITKHVPEPEWLPNNIRNSVPQQQGIDSDVWGNIRQLSGNEILPASTTSRHI